MIALALAEGCLCFVAVYAAALSGAWTLPTDWRGTMFAITTALALSACGVGALYLLDTYDPRVIPDFETFAARLPRSVAIMLMPLAPLALLSPGARVPVLMIVVAVAAVVPLLRAPCYAGMRSRFFSRRVLILGTSPLALRLAEEIEARTPWCRVVGHVGDEGAAAPAVPRPRFDPAEGLDRIIARTRPHRIIAALGERRGKLPVGALLDARLRGVVVEEGVDVYEQLTGKLAIEWLTPATLLFSRGLGRASVAMGVSRGLSLAVSVIGLVALAPLLGIVALLIRLDSPGPAFFVQERVGQGGRVFPLVKFRTMRPAGGQHSEWVRDNQDRITMIGAWLRKFRLDELPQLVNVLRGDMNLVGPRPHPRSNFTVFVTVLRNCPEWCEQIPYYTLRSMIRPGITGWAQVRYRYANDLEEEVEKTCYDLYYLKHRSFWLDLRILFDTVKTVLIGHAGTETSTAAARRLPAMQGGSDLVGVFDTGAGRGLEGDANGQPGQADGRARSTTTPETAVERARI